MTEKPHRYDVELRRKAPPQADITRREEQVTEQQYAIIKQLLRMAQLIEGGERETEDCAGEPAP